MKKAKKAAKKAAPKRAKKAAAKKKVAAVPPGYYTLTPYVVCRNAAGAIDFYKKAFGAKERLRMLGPGGSIAHAEIVIGNSTLMLGDENPQMGATAPQTIGGSATSILIYSENVDKAYAKAVAAGATPEMPPMDMFWGDRYCKFTDPFGHKWSIATHIEDVSEKETERRGKAAMAQMGNNPSNS